MAQLLEDRLTTKKQEILKRKFYPQVDLTFLQKRITIVPLGLKSMMAMLRLCG